MQTIRTSSIFVFDYKIASTAIFVAASIGNINAPVLIAGKAVDLHPNSSASFNEFV